MPDRKKTLQPIQPAYVTELAYRKQLEKLINAMSKSVGFWLEIAYKRNTPEIALLAQDASPAVAMRDAVRKLARRWQKNFNKAAPKLAEYFAQSVKERDELALKRILRKGGFSVRFTRTPAMNDLMQASIAENVSLIKSIPANYFQQIEGMIMRSVQEGGTLGDVAAELKKRHGITTKRANLIARDQNSKLGGQVQRVRLMESGFKQAIWCHSHAGIEPRKSHVKASNDKVVFDLARGWYDPDEKKWIQPGQLINCRCFYRPVLPGYND